MNDNPESVAYPIFLRPYRMMQHLKWLARLRRDNVYIGSHIVNETTPILARTLVMKQHLNWLPALYNRVWLFAIDLLNRLSVAPMLENHSDHDSEAETN